MSKLTRLMITGADGMLGRAFSKIINLHYKNIQVLALTKSDLDVANLNAVLTYKSFNPDVIVHTAAIVNADFCEDNYDEAYSVMVKGTENMVALANKCDAKIFYPQSFLIFDGLESPIVVSTEPNPLSIYGELKYESEKIILNTAKKSLVVRMAGFFGGNEKDKNFVGKIIPQIFDLIASGKKELSVGDRVWQPTFTEDLAKNSMLLIENDKQGIYHMSSLGQASFYELTLKIVEYLKIKHLIKIVQAPSKSFDDEENAVRPHEAIMSNVKLDKEGLNLQRTWESSLFDYIEDGYFIKMAQKLGVQK